MQPENKRRNPFEEHIESDLFDISELETSSDAAPLSQQLQRLLNSLPQPLDYRVWDEELDDHQKQVCAYLTTATIERLLRPNHAEELRSLSDDDLVMILTVPIALGMIAQQRLYGRAALPADLRAQLLEPSADSPRLWALLRQRLAGWRQRLLAGWQRLRSCCHFRI